MVRITRGWQRKDNVISQEPRGMKKQINFMSSHAVGCGHYRWKHSFAPVSPEVSQTQEIGVLGHVFVVCCS